LKITVNDKKYTLCTPNTLVSPNTPLINTDNYSKLEQLADVCLSFNQTHASQETYDEYTHINTIFDNNGSLKTIPGSINLFNSMVQSDGDDYCDYLAFIKYESNKFNRFMKFAMLDFAINCERITPIPVNDERTIFSEVIIPLFKYFGNITKLISFRWQVFFN
jgi:hypothetical protein